MRDRLIELMRNAPKTDTVYGDIKLTEPVQTIQTIADHLLAEGVIVPPCKVGDITYIFDYEVNNHLETKFRGIIPSVVEAITIVDDGLWIENEHAKYHISSVGDLIFLTREEAEKALERSEGDGT